MRGISNLNGVKPPPLPHSTENTCPCLSIQSVFNTTNDACLGGGVKNSTIRWFVIPIQSNLKLRRWELRLLWARDKSNGSKYFKTNFKGTVCPCNFKCRHKLNIHFRDIFIFLILSLKLGQFQLMFLKQKYVRNF